MSFSAWCWRCMSWSSEPSRCSKCKGDVIDVPKEKVAEFDKLTGSDLSTAIDGLNRKSTVFDPNALIPERPVDPGVLIPGVQEIEVDRRDVISHLNPFRPEVKTKQRTKRLGAWSAKKERNKRRRM